LLNLLWVLEHTVEMWPALAENLEAILAGDLFLAQELPSPAPLERKAQGVKPLFNAAAAAPSIDEEPA
jgi:hypothetical protein